MIQHLKQLRVHHGNQEIEGGIAGGSDAEQRHLFVSNAAQIQGVGAGQSLDGIQVEHLKPGLAGDQDGLGGFAASCGLVHRIAGDGDMIWVCLGKCFKDLIQCGSFTFLCRSLPQKIHDSGKVMDCFALG